MRRAPLRCPRLGPRAVVLLAALTLSLAASAAPRAGRGPARSVRTRTRATAGRDARPTRRLARPVRRRPVALEKRLGSRRLRRGPAPSARRVVELVRRSRIFAVDLDNTLVDTRPRTVAAVHEFARRSRRLSPETRRRLLDVTKADVGWDGTETAERLGLSPRESAGLQRVWDDMFWNSKNLILDDPIPETIALVRRARKAGKKVVFITGRKQYMRRDSIAQLRRLGLMGKDTRALFTKSTKEHTPEFKLRILRKLARSGDNVAFLDDSHENLAKVAGSGISVRPIAVDFPIGDPADVPVPEGALLMPVAGP